ncbi:MAG: hypothetical protein AAF203_07235 [Pseudomonadota bacterium]
MKNQIVLFAAALSLSFNVLAGFEDYDQSNNVFLENDLLPQADLWQGMFDDAKAIEEALNSGDFSTYKLVEKTRANGGGSAGSSVQLLVHDADGNVKGIWSPPNHATWLEGEIFAFTVSRILGRSNWAVPATRMFLVGDGRTAAKDLITSLKGRKCNKAHVVNYMTANDQFIPGAYMGFVEGFRPKEVPELVLKKGQTSSTDFNRGHWAMKMVLGTGPMPEGKPVYLDVKRGKLSLTEPAGEHRVSTDTLLARQISLMTIVDALNAQRDRFGNGSNSEAFISASETGTTDDPTFAVMGIDNGGIMQMSKGSTRSLHRFLKGNGMRRFEKEVYERIVQLDQFLNGGVVASLTIDGITYNSEADLAYAMGAEDFNGTSVKTVSEAAKCHGHNHNYLFDMDGRWNGHWKQFKVALGKISAKMQDWVAKYGEDDTFL